MPTDVVQLSRASFSLAFVAYLPAHESSFWAPSNISNILKTTPLAWYDKLAMSGMQAFYSLVHRPEGPKSGWAVGSTNAHSRNASWIDWGALMLKNKTRAKTIEERCIDGHFEEFRRTFSNR